MKTKTETTNQTPTHKPQPKQITMAREWKDLPPHLRGTRRDGGMTITAGEGWGICQPGFAHHKTTVSYIPGELVKRAWESLVDRWAEKLQQAKKWNLLDSSIRSAEKAGDGTLAERLRDKAVALSIAGEDDDANEVAVMFEETWLRPLVKKIAQAKAADTRHRNKQKTAKMAALPFDNSRWFLLEWLRGDWEARLDRIPYAADHIKEVIVADDSIPVVFVRLAVIEKGGQAINNPTWRSGGGGRPFHVTPTTAETAHRILGGILFERAVHLRAVTERAPQATWVAKTVKTPKKKPATKKAKKSPVRKQIDNVPAVRIWKRITSPQREVLAQITRNLGSKLKKHGVSHVVAVTHADPKRKVSLLDGILQFERASLNLESAAKLQMMAEALLNR